jgi:hypothetical protein
MWILSKDTCSKVLKSPLSLKLLIEFGQGSFVNKIVVTKVGSTHTAAETIRQFTAMTLRSQKSHFEICMGSIRGTQEHTPTLNPDFYTALIS